VPASRAKREEVAARRTRALQLRAAGVPYQAIADELGHTSKGAAAVDVTRALRDRQDLLDGQRDLFVTLELERLDSLERAVQAVLRQASADGEKSIVLRASDRLLRIAERRAKLLGLDAGGGEQEVPADVNPLDELRSRREQRFAGG
jgi:hypothetical protein